MIPTLEFLAGEKDVSCRQQEQTVNIFQLAFSVSPSSLTIPLLCDRQTCRQTVQKAAGVLLSNCLFSASAIVTKALCERPSWILCAFYFMVITIVVILLFLLMFFLFPQHRWLFKCKKNPDMMIIKKNKNKKLEYLYWRWLVLPPYLDINKHISVLPAYLLYAAYCIVTQGWGFGGGA